MTNSNRKTIKRSMRWSVEPDGKGAFNACFVMLEDGKARVFTNPKTGETHEMQPQAAKSHVSLEEAQAHVDFAIKTDAERDEKQALTESLFDKQNWKMPTKRKVVKTLREADAIRDALAYFCGGAEIRSAGARGWEVGSLGYYHYVGA